MPNIVLTAFPKIEFNQDGRLCGEATPRERLEGFNVGGVLSIDVPTLRPVSDFANNVLYPATRDAAARVTGISSTPSVTPSPSMGSVRKNAYRAASQPPKA